jgi:hypothetical protein
MKKIIRGVLVPVFLFTFVAAGFCWPWDKKASQEVPKAPAGQAAGQAPVAPPQAVKEAPKSPKGAADKMRALREKKKLALNNTQWEVEVSALSGKGSRQKDTFIFYENKFSAEEFLKKGYKPSNYTVTVQEDGSAFIETMQSSDKEGVVFWRLEFDPAMVSCKGLLSSQLPNNRSEDYSFVSVARKLYVPPAEVPKEAALPPQQEAKK